ncbi:MAG: hypothetical protein PHZ09_12530 [Eubacteriales bacterium]|jgi:hypothetical protein|nr:hypothetical protein [Eubacteriales bacterium]
MPKALKIIITAAILLLIAAVLFAVVYIIDLSLTGTVVSSFDRFIIVELDEGSVYRTVFSKDNPPAVKLYTPDVQKYAPGDRIFAFTRSGSESSLPPGIGAIIIIKIGG